jgi:hypothetical protein
MLTDIINQINQYKSHHETRIVQHQVGADVSLKILNYWELIDVGYLFTCDLLNAPWYWTTSSEFWYLVWKDTINKLHKTGKEMSDINHSGAGYVAVEISSDQWFYISFWYGSCEECDTVSRISKREELVAYFEKSISNGKVVSKKELDEIINDFDFAIDE